MVFLKANDARGEDVELDITFEDDDGWGLSVVTENAAGDEKDDWYCTDFNELRPFFRRMREMCDKFYAIDTQTYSIPEEPARPCGCGGDHEVCPAQGARPKGGAVLVELGEVSNSGPGRTTRGKH